MLDKLHLSKYSLLILFTTILLLLILQLLLLFQLEMKIVPILLPVSSIFSSLISISFPLVTLTSILVIGEKKKIFVVGQTVNKEGSLHFYWGKDGWRRGGIGMNDVHATGSLIKSFLCLKPGSWQGLPLALPVHSLLMNDVERAFI